MYVNSFSVSGSFILLKAFKEHIEQGTNWEYDDIFTSFNISQYEHCKDLYFNGREDTGDEWGSMRPQHFSLSNSDPDERKENFHLPQDWETATAFAREENANEIERFLEILPRSIPKSHSVVFDRKSNTLHIGCQQYNKEAVKNLMKITEGGFLSIRTAYGEFDYSKLKQLLSIFK